MSKDVIVSQDFIVGSIYWPIIDRVKMLRSETIPFSSSDLFSNSTEVYCPHLENTDDCRLKKNKNRTCGYKTSRKTKCSYDDYHELFLLLKKNSNNGNHHFLKCYNESVVKKDKKLSGLYSSKKRTHFPTTLNAFPQTNTKKSGLKAFSVYAKTMPDGLFFYTPPGSIYGKDQLELESIKKLIHVNDIVYAKSEFLTREMLEEDKKDSEDAFGVLVNKDKIKQILPSDSVSGIEKDIYLPVQLSFFADSKMDAILSLAIKNDEEIEQNARLVRQALGSMREVIYNQRQKFLEKWCMRLGERVDDICQKNNPENQYKATKEAMQFALKAIFNMTQTLAAKPSARNIKKISKSFNYKTDKKNPEQIFKCINENYIEKLDKLDKIGIDRKKYVIDFCKKAEMYAEEFVVSEGKLKGRLSAPTVRELKKISLTSNPVNARILIKGEPGGGKGVTAEDFHFYCMKRIAEPKNNNVKNYIEKVEDRLKTIFRLPANYNTSIAGASANLFFRQISNTGWWLWNQSLKNDDFKGKIDEFLAIQHLVMQKVNVQTESKYFEKDNNGHEEKLIERFSGLLETKISLEIESGKPDFSFNMLQVNCGILGGENSELSESIKRLFGTSGDYNTAIPGLFQTCSYVGGTLFLDEIADAPVRVQDNLLRPLEEGTVSRPGWETFSEKVDNIRIIGATFMDLFKLAQQYQETLPSGNPKGFRPDLLTRLTRNPPVSVTPVWHYFVPTKPIDDDFPSQFAFVLNNSWEVSTVFWRRVHLMVSEQIGERRKKARYHISGTTYDGRRKFASKITMRLFKEVGKIAQLKDSTKKPKEIDAQRKSALDYLSRMLDYLLVETN